MPWSKKNGILSPMSKHSKWAKIKRQKGVADVKKGSAFTKLGNAIAIAARGGDDLSANFKLRLAIDKARTYNMPNDTIERAIARGAGKLEGQIIEEVTYEGFGPGGTAIIIETTTDNTNRTVNDIKRLLQQHGGTLGGPNSVRWKFDRKGTITIPKNAFSPELELALIDAGAQDIQVSDDGVTILATPEQLQSINRVCADHDITSIETTIEWIPKEYTPIDDTKKESLKKLFEDMDTLDDLQEWYSDVNLENF